MWTLPGGVAEKAKSAATRALELDPTLGEAHAALGTVQHFLEWDWAAAEQSYQRALELTPGLSNTHVGFGLELTVQGQFEAAIEHFETAVRLDPLMAPFWQFLGALYHFAGDDERALALLGEAEQLFPSFAHQTLGMILCEHGRFDEGLASLERARVVAGDMPDLVAALAYGHALAGNETEARALLGQLNQRAQSEFVSPLNFALVHTVLGEREQALGWLERGYAFRFAMLPMAMVWPPLRPLHAEPRFQAMLRGMGLQPKS